VKNPNPKPFWFFFLVFFFLYYAFIVYSYRKLCAALAMKRIKHINQTWKQVKATARSTYLSEDFRSETVGRLSLNRGSNKENLTPNHILCLYQGYN